MSDDSTEYWAPMQGGDLHDAQCELKAQRRDPHIAGQQQLREWGTGTGPRLTVQTAAEGMGKGLFVDNSTTDKQWTPQLLPRQSRRHASTHM